MSKTSINTVADGGRVRRPRGIVKINGTVMPGWLEWDVSNNSHYQSDTFRVTFALSKLPAQYGAAWWASQTGITVEIFAGFPVDPENFTEGQLVSWIYGNVDDVEYDPVGTQVHLSGRDLTSLFIDTKTTEKWQNLTSSQIATQLAQRHGLTAAVTATSTKAGNFYEIDNAQMNDQRSEWDLLTYLAGKEEFVVYVKGQELHFEPKADPAKTTPYLLQWEDYRADSDSPGFNGKTIKFSRNLTIARGVIVVVKSWNAKQKKGFTATWPKISKGITPGTPGPKGGAQTYVFAKPGLTQQQADEMAQNKHREITRHEMKFQATMPADDLLTTTCVVKVDGTGSMFDQVYFPDTVERRMSISEGYAMSVSAKNHNTDSETLA